MITFNEKNKRVALCGQEFTLEYFQRVQAPLLVDALKWSPESLIDQMTREGIPLGQFARVPLVQSVLVTRAQIAEREQREEAERKRIAHYNSPEQVKLREQQKAALHKHRLEQAALIRGARPTTQSLDRNFIGGGINSNGDWE